jgi:CRISPR-associated protein Cas1
MGARLEKEYQKLLVSKDGEVLLAVPLAQVSAVVLIGNIGVTTPALNFLLEQGVELTLLNSAGKLRGRLVGAHARNLALRQAQYTRAADAAFCLALSRAVVQGKLQNYQTLCLRLARAREADAMRHAADALGKHIGLATEAADLAALRGVEGSGSKIYFSVLRDALRRGAVATNPEETAPQRSDGRDVAPQRSDGRDIAAQRLYDYANAAAPTATAQQGAAEAADQPSKQPANQATQRPADQATRRLSDQAPPMGFEKRARRPSPDPINAMLSLGYTLLTENLYAALTIVGLDPHNGFFHADAYGRPALALDLVEEFRGIVADSVVLTLVNKRMVDEHDFEPSEDGGVRLKDHALRRFLRQYHQRLQTEVIHPLVGRRLTYQKCFEVQARLLRKVIEGSAAEYLPFRTR